MRARDCLLELRRRSLKWQSGRRSQNNLRLVYMGRTAVFVTNSRSPPLDDSMCGASASTGVNSGRSFRTCSVNIASKGLNYDESMHENCI